MSLETYHEIVDFANVFKDLDVTYCQYKPEIVFEKRVGFKESYFWKVRTFINDAKDILVINFNQMYKFEDLVYRENFVEI